MQWGCRGRRASLLGRNVLRWCWKCPQGATECLCSKVQLQHYVFPTSSSHHISLLDRWQNCLGLAEKLPWGSSIRVGRHKRSRSEGRGLGSSQGRGAPQPPTRMQTDGSSVLSICWHSSPMLNLHLLCSPKVKGRHRSRESST